MSRKLLPAVSKQLASNFQLDKLQLQQQHLDI